VSAVKLILVAWITVNALIQFGRGCAGHKRTYTVSDGVLGVLESAVAIWLVSTL
jgi:hypothetical protein